MVRTLLILCGGQSDEHEISLISAKCILDALDRSRFRPLVVGISKRGHWHLADEKTFYKGEVRADRISLDESTPLVTVSPRAASAGKGQLTAGGRTETFDAVFPVLHGTLGEDGTVQGMLDVMGVPYVGSGCEASAVCMDKVLTKALCRVAGIPVAEWITLSSVDQIDARAAELRALGDLRFVKPARQGSSVGVTRVTRAEDLRAAVEKALRHDTKCLVERGIRGREIECGVLGLHGDAKASVPGEIVVSQSIGWYSYEAKYLLPDAAETLTPAPLPEGKAREVGALAVHAFDTLECDGMARVDMFLEEGTQKLFLNEVNTIPGFTPISMYPKMWEKSGVSYGELITRLVDLAVRRQAARKG